MLLASHTVEQVLDMTPSQVAHATSCIAENRGVVFGMRTSFATSVLNALYGKKKGPGKSVNIGGKGWKKKAAKMGKDAFLGLFGGAVDSKVQGGSDAG